MKKTVLIISALVMVVTSVFAQNIFFATKEGMKLYYTYMDAKGKATSYSCQTIKKVEGSGENLNITYVTQLLDKNRKPLSDNPLEIPYTVAITNGVVKIDMKSFGAPGTESFLQVEGDNILIPSSMAPGTKLDDVKFTLTLNMGLKIRTETAITEHECVAVEDITVPAGTYKCYKVTQTSTSTVVRKTIVQKLIYWYSPGIGTVKSETYNDKGKLESSMALQAVE